jgi:hypothetical protein
MMTAPQVLETNNNIDGAHVCGADDVKFDVVKKRRAGGESATSARRIRAIEEKQLAALEYRKLGYTYAQIAEVLGYAGKQGAYEAIQSALTRVIRDPAEDVIRLDLTRLDALFIKPYQDALNGDLAALSACLVIMARRARLLGLDAPIKKQMSGPSGAAITAVVHHMTEADMCAAAERLCGKY